MLERLALKHDTWVKFARQICKDNYLADDIVSEMYLKFSQYDKEINDWYVYFALKHLYLHWIKKESNFCELSGNFVYDESEARKEIELPDNLSWVEKQVLILRQKFSCRDIEKKYHINYLKIHRIEKQAKEKLKQEWGKPKYKDLVI